MLGDSSLTYTHFGPAIRANALRYLPDTIGQEPATVHISTLVTGKDVIVGISSRRLPSHWLKYAQFNRFDQAPDLGSKL